MALLRVLALVLSFSLAPTSEACAVSEGERIPGVSLSGLAAKPLDLAVPPTRVMLIDFWATWCAPCEGQLRRLEELADQFPAEDLMIVAVSIDATSDAPRRFLARRFPDARFYPAHDPSGAILSEFGAQGVPALYVVDATGIVRARHFGPGELPDLSGQVHRLVAEARPGQAERLVARPAALSNSPASP